ncbi:hypothetical protein ACXR2U_02170 [Jatrophihabitans sp. YIM 134969]
MTTQRDDVLDPAAGSDRPDPASTEPPVTGGDVTAEARPDALLPVWFEWGLVVVVAALVCVTGAGLLLALLGRYGLVPALLWGLLGTVLFVALALPGSVRTREGRSAHLPTLAMCVVALGSVLFNSLRAGHYVFVDRDPGVYAVAGRWLARTGTLRVQAGDPWVSVSRTTNFASAGMYPEPGGFLEFQFNHLFSVLLAVAQGIGGDRVMFAVNGVVGGVGLLMVYAVGVRLCRRPWLVVAGLTGLALTLPQLLFSRDTYSEPFTQLLLWSAMWLLLTAWERRRLGLAALGGLALGATVMVRVDALLYLGVLPVVAALAFCASSRGSGRRFAAAWVGTALLAAVPPVVLGSIDVQERAGGYYAALKSSVDGLRMLLVASLVVGLVVMVIGPRIPGLGWLVSRVRDRFAVGAGLFVSGALALVWALRPALQHPLGISNTTTAGLQRQEGIPVSPRLTYSQDTMTWFGWYLGPITLALAVVGLGLLTTAAIRGRRASLIVLATTGPAAALYLYNVSNTPEQVWAMRRYVPAVFPLFVLAAVVAVEAVLALLRFAPWRPWLQRAVAVAAVAAFIAFPLGVLGPVRDFETQVGYLPAIDKTCDTLGPDAAVVFVYPDVDGIVLTQTVRSFCGVPATRFSVTDPTPTELAAVSDAARAQGRTLWVLGSSQQGVETAVDGSAPVQQIADVTNDRKLEATISRLPDSYDSQSLLVWGARVG